LKTPKRSSLYPLGLSLASGLSLEGNSETAVMSYNLTQDGKYSLAVVPRRQPVLITGLGANLGKINALLQLLRLVDYVL
jgi:hypothetical protein